MLNPPDAPRPLAAAPEFPAPPASTGWLAPAALLLAFLGLLFAWAMHRDLNHDEHQFLVPGSLLAQSGLLPFRDYPLFHLPNLTLVYGALDRLTGYPILSAKLLSVLSSWIIGLLLVIRSYRNPAFGEKRWALAGALMALCFLFFDPLFAYTSGKTWNHEFPTALAFLGALLMIEAIKNERLWPAFGAGIAVGFAIGTRLTFLPILLPLALVPLISPVRRPWGLIFALAGGALIGLLPSLYLYHTDPAAFLFGNLEFPRLRLLDPENTRIQKTVNWGRKIRFFFKEVAVPSWPLFLAYLVIGFPSALRWWRRRTPADFTSGVLLLMLPFIIAGCFAPSRYQYQHYFVVIPFLVWGIVAGMGAAQRAHKLPLIMALLLVGSASTYAHSTFFKKGAPGLGWLAEAFKPSQWFALQAHEYSQRIRSLVGPGKVLTLAPAWVTEAGTPIYPEFATGPFAWRSASLLAQPRRARLKIIAPDDLDSFLAVEPPAAILLGVEDPALEAPIRNYAQAHHYQPANMNKKRELWLAPKSVVQ